MFFTFEWKRGLYHLLTVFEPSPYNLGWEFVQAYLSRSPDLPGALPQTISEDPFLPVVASVGLASVQFRITRLKAFPDIQYSFVQYSFCNIPNVHFYNEKVYLMFNNKRVKSILRAS